MLCYQKRNNPLRTSAQSAEIDAEVLSNYALLQKWQKSIIQRFSFLVAEGRFPGGDVYVARLPREHRFGAEHQSSKARQSLLSPLKHVSMGAPVLPLLTRVLFCLLFCGQDNSEWGPRQNNVLPGRGNSGLRSSFAVIGKVSVQSRESTIGLRRMDKPKASARGIRFHSTIETHSIIQLDPSTSALRASAQDDPCWRFVQDDPCCHASG